MEKIKGCRKRKGVKKMKSHRESIRYRKWEDKREWT
jgi:hypothetical protein